MGVFVTKADGSRQLFDREKIVRTCLRMGASRKIADEVVERVEKMLYNDIPTSKILQITFRLLRNYKPAIRHVLDLRRGLSLMDSKPEFEVFVQILLAHNGFEVSPNRLVKGKCVEHEVDAIARKDGVTYFVEAKHHVNYHTPTGLDESRIARAILEDVSEGFQCGSCNLKIDRAMIVTNTRYSEHARRYGKCRNILQIGWSSPSNLSLQSMIEEENLYPLSCLRGLKRKTKTKLVNSGIVVMKQLFEEKPLMLARKTGVSKETLKQITEKAENIVVATREFS
ncbi:restriction endonuclease [Candidatus Bathyarchaeota archaeon]|nr:restriction endonuclease [Candidatus Bathyarchaeota archaeon]